MPDELERFEGSTFICEVPKELGAVTKLEVKGGGVIARTESGTSMIVPVGNGQLASNMRK